MSRPVMLGNGALTVGLNEHGLVHDFYYPYVGLDNLTTARSTHHKIGIWIDGQFSWVDDGSWNIQVDFEADALVSNIKLHNNHLEIDLELQDFVDSDLNVFFRNIKVSNLSEEAREVRVFLHQVFQISRGGRADTALFVPDENYILDYKGRCALLIYAQNATGIPFDQYAVGNYGIEGKEGTYIDAEDGELSGSAVEHGGVDSVIRFKFEIAAHSSTHIDYWIIAAESQFEAENIHLKIRDQSLAKRISMTRSYWHEWLSCGDNVLKTLDSKYIDITKKSMMLIKAHTDKRGGIIASCDSSIYNYGRDYYSYVWPRDGAYAIWPLIRLGYRDEAKNFFEFCKDILTPDGYLMHKYQPDKAIGSTWHPLLHGKKHELAIQEDETASVLYMLGEYYRYSGDTTFVESMYADLVQPMANFMASYIDEQTGLPHASYDLWEEKFLTHTYTVANTYQALLVAADFADKFQQPEDSLKWRETAQNFLQNFDIFQDTNNSILRKGYLLASDGSLKFDNTLDISSFYGVMTFGFYNDPKIIHNTIKAIETRLLDQSPSGGSPRYENDHYFEVDNSYAGNPWFVTTLWLAQYYVRSKQHDKAKHYVDWAMSKSLPGGVLPEQIHPVESTPLSVAPLVWSHAELINTILDISKV